MLLIRLLLILAVIAAFYGLALLAMLSPWFLVAGVGTAVAVAAKRYYRLSAFGTARFAEESDLEQKRMLDAERGLMVGCLCVGRPSLLANLKALFNPRVTSARACRKVLRSKGRWRHQLDLVRLVDAVHVAVFAPTGVGKNVSLIAYHLLTCPESTVIVDFKGENFRLSAEHRRKKFAHRIVVLDPFKVVTQNPDCLNPLDLIDRTSPLALDDCRDLSEALVVKTGQERDLHWVEAAEAWIAAMIAVVVEFGMPHDRSLQTVRTLLSNPKKMEAAIELMCNSTAWDGMLSRLGFQLTHFKDKELASTLTTANRFLRFLDTLAIAASTTASSFDPAQLREKTTVYLVLPPEHLRAQSSLLRMWLGALMRAVVKLGLHEKKKVHFVLDEAASVGSMAIIDDAIDKFRGYGIRLQFYYQSLGQLKKCFPEGQDQTLLSNTTQIFFGVNDQPTAEYVSARLGEETQIVTSGGASSSRTWQSSDQDGKTSTSFSASQNDNWQQHARKLLKPEEVLALSERIAITFAAGIPPLWTTLVRFYEEPRLGQKPGWFGRSWEVVQMFASALFLFALALLFAYAMTVVVNEKSLIPQQVPNGSGPWRGF